MKDAETPQQPELSSEDRDRIFKATKNYCAKIVGRCACPDFNAGAEYATLHERAAAQARIKELETLLKRSVDLMCGANRNGILLEGAWWTEQIQELLRRKEIRPYKP